MHVAADIGIVEDMQRLVLGADLVEQLPGALDIHQPVVRAVRHDGRHFDVLGNAFHCEGGELLYRFLMGDAAEQALAGRLQMLVKQIEIVEDRIAAAPEIGRASCRERV